MALKSNTALFLTQALFLIHACNPSDGNHKNNWPEYFGGPDCNHYSHLDHIHTGNVNQLQIAWTYETANSGQMQVNPLIIDGILFGVTPSVQAFALDAATGKEL